MRRNSWLVALGLSLSMPGVCHAQGAVTPVMRPAQDELAIVKDGTTSATIVMLADAAPPPVLPGRRPKRLPDPLATERHAGEDLAKYIEMMSGAKPRLIFVGTPPAAFSEAPYSTVPPSFTLGEIPNDGPVFIVGRAALQAEPALQRELDRVVKKDPVTRADAMVLKRAGSRVYLAGNNQEATYYAVTQLLQDWGCRWFMPTEFGEAVPEKKNLSIGALNAAYAPPFELRHYWIAWRGSTQGFGDFKLRNYMANNNLVGMGHALKDYTGEVTPPGKSHFNISFSDPKTAEAIAKVIEPGYAQGRSYSVAIEDGNYDNDSEADRKLLTEWDKYTLRMSYTDAMLTLYNNVGKMLREKYPESKAKLGGMAYNNVTLPPKIVKKLEPNIVMWIAPIDIDPIHGMDSPLSPPRREYKDMMYEWAKLTEGRLAIYDYDQGMLVWRDLPIPSHTAFAQDVKHYRDAGILGIGTESRNAIATTFTNFYIRGQLMWNPDQDVKALLADFYPKFYGPAAGPMADYWNAIYDAWDKTPVTEHEYMIIPAIYTPELVNTLRAKIAEAQKIVAPLKAKADLSRNEKLYLDRVAFTQLSFDVIDNYTAKVHAEASEVDYKTAADYADKGLAARDALTKMNPVFTTPLLETGRPMWWKGEPGFMRELLAYTDGTKGTLVAKTRLEWSFQRGEPLPADWRYKGQEGDTPVGDTTQATGVWQGAGVEKRRTDLYLQGQGLLNPDGQSYSGHYWYQTTLDLNADQIGDRMHLMFPGLFNEAWLYLNGELVAHRPLREPWWQSDYRFTWDVDLKGKLKPGQNVFTLRGFNPHHFGGIFRRPFLYRATTAAPVAAPN